MLDRSFLAALKGLHAKAKAGTMTEDERARYADGCEQITREIIAADQAKDPGKFRRVNLRVVLNIMVELRPERGVPTHTLTVDVGSGGFAILLPPARLVASSGIGLDKSLAFTLFLAPEKIEGRCTVVSSRVLDGSRVRVGFAFDALDPIVRRPLDLAIFDVILDDLGTG
jgi:hypothetical protein